MSGLQSVSPRIDFQKRCTLFSYSSCFSFFRVANFPECKNWKVEALNP